MGQETKPPVNHEITTDQIACFIDEIAALPCPACGADEWGLVNDNIAGSPSLVFSKSGNLTVEDHGHYVPLVALGCGKCFYIRLHALLPLLEHLSRKEQSKANDLNVNMDTKFATVDDKFAKVDDKLNDLNVNAAKMDGKLDAIIQKLDGKTKSAAKSD